MSIRPRTNGVWHVYQNLYDDLRSGRLSVAEYDTMIQEDRVESDRRKALVDGAPGNLVAAGPDRWQEIRELLLAAESLVSQARLKTETIILTPYRDELPLAKAAKT